MAVPHSILTIGAGFEIPSGLARALAGLESYNGAQCVVDVVRYGAKATPGLRRLLLSRDRSGLHQARCRATDALVAIGAYDVLAEFLRLDRPLDDPIEKLGEDIVISAAARALARRHDHSTFTLLAELARTHRLTGVLVGLGSFRRTISIPIFVEALGEDEVRLTAEASLRSYGSRARPYLLTAACNPTMDGSESSFRLRRSVLGLLGELRSRAKDWDQLKPLVSSPDLETAILAAAIGLKIGSAAEKRAAACALQTLRAKADWLRRMQIDQYLKRFRAGHAKEMRGRIGS